MKPDIREMPIDELRVLKVYRDLVPRPLPKDLELLRAEIRAHGLDPSRPLVVNGDLVVLDGHSRLEIAKDLGLEWALVTIKELEDNWAEREFVIKANLARRQLNTAQRADLGLKLLDIERERAKRRQQLAGQMYGRGQESPGQEEFLQKWVQGLQEQAVRERTEGEKVSAIFRGPIESAQLPVNDGDRLGEQFPEAITRAQTQKGKAIDLSNDGKLVPKWVQAITKSQRSEGEPEDCHDSIMEQGRALDLAAKQAGVGRGTLQRAAVVQQAAQEDPEIANQWEKAKSGGSSVHQVYRKVRLKDRPPTYGHEIDGPFSRKPEEKPAEKPREEQPWFTEEEILALLFAKAHEMNVCRESLQWVIDHDPLALTYWNRILEGILDPIIGWSFITDRVEDYETAEIAKLASEKPLPADAEYLGPWVLDGAQAETVADLARTFPAETAHLILTDARQASIQELESLAALGQRALVPGKPLCAYISPGVLPQALNVFTGAGLTYRWLCSVARPQQQDYHPALHTVAVVEQWWPMLIMSKPSPEARQFSRFEDSDDGEKWPYWPEKEDEWTHGGDALISQRLYVKGMPRQMIYAFTAPGQLVVDPLGRDGGVMAMVALETNRRYLLFHQDGEQAVALDFRLKQEEAWARRRQTKH